MLIDLMASDDGHALENARHNPLGKIPTLIDAGEAIYDSRVILNHLDQKSDKAALFPPTSPVQSHAPTRPVQSHVQSTILTRAALIDGALDAAILIVYEYRKRPKGMQVDSIIDAQRTKIANALTALEAQSLHYDKGARPDAADIGLVCLLDYLDFRELIDWQSLAPSLRAFMKDFSGQVPGYTETLPKGTPPRLGVDWGC